MFRSISIVKTVKITTVKSPTPLRSLVFISWMWNSLTVMWLDLHLLWRLRAREEWRNPSFANARRLRSLRLEIPATLTYAFPVSFFQQYRIKICQFYNEFWKSYRFLDMNVNDLTANVQSPNGRIEEAQIIETEDNNYSIRFIPKVRYQKL